MASQSYGSSVPSGVSSIERKCKCGHPLELKTSWSEKNQGRRYYKCPIIIGETTACGYFDWLDPPPCRVVLKSKLPNVPQDAAVDDDALAKREMQIELASFRYAIERIEVALSESKKRQDMYFVVLLILIALGVILVGTELKLSGA